jgi:ACR3 family arsenite transporter
MMNNIRLKFLDRFLTLWIFLAMGVGVLLGNIIPNVEGLLSNVAIGTTNVPLAIGLILMMYPPLTKVDFATIPATLSNKRLLFSSLFITWIVGPFLMFLLAITFLPKGLKVGKDLDIRYTEIKELSDDMTVGGKIIR